MTAGLMGLTEATGIIFRRDYTHSRPRYESGKSDATFADFRDVPPIQSPHVVTLQIDESTSAAQFFNHPRLEFTVSFV